MTEHHRAADPPEEGRVFVLRVWYEGDAGPDGRPGTWRASLREGAGAPRVHFLEPDDLLEHLHGELTRH